MAAKNLSHRKSYIFQGCSKSNEAYKLFLPLNGADFDQGGSCSWSPGGQLAATPWPLPTAPWPPTAQLASLTSPPTDQWGLASFALGQSERLIAGLRLAPPMGGLDRWPRAGTLDRDRWLGSAHHARPHTSCRHYRDPQIASKKGMTVCFFVPFLWLEGKVWWLVEPGLVDDK